MADEALPYGGPTGQTLPPDAPKFAEIGVSGLRVFSGYLDEEFLRELKGWVGRKTYRQMSDNDSTVAAVLSAIGLVIRACDWNWEPAEDAPADQAEAEAQFAESLFLDMSHSKEDFLSEALTMLVFGWAFHEVVIKVRVGPLETDPSKRSAYTDGRIGIRKLAPRAQETLLNWIMQPDGGISGMVQLPPTGSGSVTIPISRALLFRTTSRKNSPEGISILRGAYESWYYLKSIRPIEATGIERELAGLPVVSIPAKYLTSTDPADMKVLASYKRVARDLKFNEQGALVLPSDMWPDVDGNPSAQPLVKIELVHSGGTRAIDTDKIKEGYKRDIANSVLAGFILLGEGSKGSYALSKDKTDFFLRACEALINQLVSVINTHLIPRIFDYNGIDRALLPKLKAGKLAATDLGVLGAFIQAIAAAGAPLFPDDDLEAALRDEADLPPKSPDAAAEQEAQRQQEADAAATAAQTAQANANAAVNPEAQQGAQAA